MLDQAGFSRRLARVWDLPWASRHKEALWRLSVNGVRGAGGHGICHSASQCPCGWRPTQMQLRAPQDEGAPALRAHHFWDCPVTGAVLSELERCLPAGLRLHRSHVWLCVPPGAGVDPDVWRVVAVAALAAIWHGYRLKLALFLGEDEGEAPVPAASRLAVADFWCRLDDFVVGLRAEGAAIKWRGRVELAPDHSFIASVPGAPGLFQLNMPAD